MNEPPDFPQYRTRLIASCPECCTDLIDEAYEFWCPACQRAVSFAEVAYFDETDYDRD